MQLDPKSGEACKFIFNAVREAGGRAYLVGGCVRDWLLGIEPKDIDVEIYGIESDRIEKILKSKFRIEMVGKSFGVWILKGLNIDVSMPRRERKTGEGHRAFDVEGDPFMSPKEACSRRDFTINAILYDYSSKEILDPFNGREDLQKKILRHTSERFREDPLRVLRAMQFSARFNMDVAPETVKMCSEISMENLPHERLFEEWKKLILKGEKISKGLFFLKDCGWIKYFPELEACVGCEQDPEWHPEGDVFVHTSLSMDSFARARIGDEREDLIVGLAVLCHDFGKPLCSKVGDDGKIHSYGHDVLGEKPTRTFLERITREKSLIDAVIPLVKRHMAVLDLWRNKAGDAAIRRLSAKVERIDRLVRIDAADRGGRFESGNDEEKNSPQGEWILKKAEILSIKDSAPKPILMGRHLQDLGYVPSKKFGEVLKDAYEAQLDGEFFDEKEALEFFKKHLASRLD